MILRKVHLTGWEKKELLKIVAKKRAMKRKRVKRKRVSKT